MQTGTPVGATWGCDGHAGLAVGHERAFVQPALVPTDSSDAAAGDTLTIACLGRDQLVRVIEAYSAADVQKVHPLVWPVPPCAACHLQRAC